MKKKEIKTLNFKVFLLPTVYYSNLKKMKKILHLFISAILLTMFTNCSTYQYVNLKSNLKSGPYGEIINENDTLLIQYSFAGENQPVNIKISNKHNKPVYVNWKSSAIIINGHSYPLWNESAIIKLNTDTEKSRIFDYLYESTSVGTIVKTEPTSFIPPNSTITFTKKNIAPQFISVPDNATSARTQIYTREGAANAKKYSFNQGDTPLNIRLYLTFSMNEQMNPQFNVDDAFWISDIISTMASPKEIPNKPANGFQLEKMTGFGTAMVAVLVIPLLVVLAAAGGGGS